MFFIIAIDINECDTSPCSSDATCSNIGGSFQCTCNNGFSGNGVNCTGTKLFILSCDVFLTNFSYVILTWQMFFNAIVDIDECSLSVLPCHSNATCSNTGGSFYCTCKNGFSGNATSCTGTNIFLKY